MDRHYHYRKAEECATRAHQLLLTEEGSQDTAAAWAAINTTREKTTSENRPPAILTRTRAEVGTAKDKQSPWQPRTAEPWQPPVSPPQIMPLRPPDTPLPSPRRSDATPAATPAGYPPEQVINDQLAERRQVIRGGRRQAFHRSIFPGSASSWSPVTRWPGLSLTAFLTSSHNGARSAGPPLRSRTSGTGFQRVSVCSVRRCAGRRDGNLPGPPTADGRCRGRVGRAQCSGEGVHVSVRETFHIRRWVSNVDSGHPSPSTTGAHRIRHPLELVA
jgi:hypothetical protein